MESTVEAVVVTANDVWGKLNLYFEQMEPPKEAQLRDMLGKLRNRRLVRVQWHEDPNRFGDSQVEILPTLPRVIPFENLAAWEQQASGHQPQHGVPEPTLPLEET
jgi:hypothetical protein